jgi:hypothetical protein
MIDELLKDHYLRTATNHFLVERFLAGLHSEGLGLLARFALTLMAEPNPYVTADRLARQMGVPEIDAKAALEELLAVGHVYRTSYGKDSWYRFTTERIDFEYRSKTASASPVLVGSEKASVNSGDW